MRITFNRAGLKIRGHVFGKASHPQDAVILSHGFMANERMCHKYADLLTVVKSIKKWFSPKRKNYVFPV